VVAKFKKRITEKKELELIEKLSHANIIVYSLSKCYLGEKKEQGLILGYAAVRSNKMNQKVKQMKDIIQKEM